MEIKAGATGSFTKEIPEFRAAMVCEHFLQTLRIQQLQMFSQTQVLCLKQTLRHQESGILYFY